MSGEKSEFGEGLSNQENTLTGGRENRPYYEWAIAVREVTASRTLNLGVFLVHNHQLLFTTSFEKQETPEIILSQNREENFGANYPIRINRWCIYVVPNWRCFGSWQMLAKHRTFFLASPLSPSLKPFVVVDSKHVRSFLQSYEDLGHPLPFCLFCVGTVIGKRFRSPFPCL